MTYKEFYEKYPIKQFGEVMVCFSGDGRPHHFEDMGWYSEEEDIDFSVEKCEWIIFLNHSCDEWVIGGVQDAEEMAQNILKAIEFCNSTPREGQE